MQHYRSLEILARLFKVLGALGIVSSIVVFIAGLGRLGFFELFSQLLVTLFAALLLLGFANLIVAIMEIVQRLRKQDETLARIEIKINHLQKDQSNQSLS